MYSAICAVCDCFCVRCIHKRCHGWGVVDLDSRILATRTCECCHSVPEAGMISRAPARGVRRGTPADPPMVPILRCTGKAGMDDLLTSRDLKARCAALNTFAGPPCSPLVMRSIRIDTHRSCCSASPAAAAAISAHFGTCSEHCSR